MRCVWFVSAWVVLLAMAEVVCGQVPVIEQQPIGQSTCPDSTVTLMCGANTGAGIGPITYRWMKDGEPIFDSPGRSGTDTSALTITGFSAADAGEYRVNVSQPTGSALSDIAALLLMDTARWTYTPVLPQNREGGVIVYDSLRQRMVMFGGLTEYLGRLSDTWEYDGAIWVPRVPAASPSGRQDHAMAYDSARRRVVMFGGTGSAGVLSETWEYDGTTWVQRSPTVSPPARRWHVMTYDALRQRVVMFGGVGPGSRTDTWEYDGNTWVQRSFAVNPPPLSQAAMVYDASRQCVVMFGGTTGSGSDASDMSRDETWEYDGSAWTRRTLNVRPLQRYRHGMAYDASRQRVVLFGGIVPMIAGTSGTTGDTWEYDGTSWVQRTQVARSWRDGHAMAYDTKRRRVVTFGGHASGGLSARHSDTWEYDGTSWVERAFAIDPSPRNSPAMTYDTARRRTVMFGGYGNITQGVWGAFSDTWEHDGTSWVQRRPAVSPSARGSAMAYDTLRQRAVLFGGSGAATFADTWEFDGTNWSQQLPAVSPPARSWHAMVFDTARRRVVLFGGAPDSGGYLADTWEYDGTNWEQRLLPVNPPARVGHAMAYDASRQRVVLFGGYSDAGMSVLSDTWEYDGAGWIERSPIAHPTGRLRHAMAFDISRQRTAMFGGGGSGSYVADTWEYDGTNWSQRSLISNPLPQGSHAMVYDASYQRVVMFGGNERGDTWLLGDVLLNIHSQPVSRYAAQGSYAELSIIADGVPPLSYQWRRNGVALSDSPNVMGTQSNVLRINALMMPDVGVYVCIVSDACGTTLASLPAKVTFCQADFDCSGDVTLDDLFIFFNAWFTGANSADIDGDGADSPTIDDLFLFINLWFDGC